MDDPYLQFGILSIACFAAGFVQSFLGFGYAIVSLAMLPYFIDVKDANLVVSLSMVLPLALAMWNYRAELRYTIAASCISGVLLGLPIGLLTFSYVNADWLVRGTGLVILLISIDGLRERRLGASRNDPPARQAKWSWRSAVAGAGSGFLAGSVGIGGPPLAAFGMRQGWSPLRFKAFVISVSLFASVLKAISIASVGWLNAHLLTLTAISIPSGMIGGQLGTVVSHRVKPRWFRRLAFLMLSLVSVGMMLRGARG